MQRLIYATWDGPDQNYLSTLFLPIFSALRPLGYQVSVLQHTWAGSNLTDAEAAAARRLEVPYRVRRVSPIWRKIGLPVLIARGGLELVRVAHAAGARRLLARSIIPAAMSLVALKLDPTLELVFDADGLMADERVDFSGWSPRSLNYNFLRLVEADALRTARAVITRTHKSRSILSARAGAGSSEEKIFVVPNGKDRSLFAPRDSAHVTRIRREWSVPDFAPWIVYAGSLGQQYHPAQMLRFLAHVQMRAPEATLHWFTLAERQARELLKQNSVSNVRVARLAAERVPEVLAAADLGIAFRTTSFSQAAVSPIKIAEYLLSGLPVISTRAGDLDQQLAGCEGALLLCDVDETNLSRAANWFLEQVLPRRELCRDACRRRGLEYFALDRCVAGYLQALQYADG